MPILIAIDKSGEQHEFHHETMLSAINHAREIAGQNMVKLSVDKDNPDVHFVHTQRVEDLNPVIIVNGGLDVSV